MSQPENDLRNDDLRARIHGAVSDVEPTPALGAIRERTTGAPHGARAWLGILGAAAAVAVIVSGIAFIEHSTPPVDANGAIPSPRPTPGGAQNVKAVGYFVGSTGSGPRLYAESSLFRGRPGDPTLQVVTSAVVTGDTDDADLHSAFPSGTTARVQSVKSSWNVDLLGNAAAIAADPGDGSGDVGVQAVVRTVQRVVGASGLVTFSINGKHADRVLGVDTRGAVKREPDVDVMAPVRISSPGNFATVGSTFLVSGEAATFEANVQWELKQGRTVVQQGFTTAAECCTPSPYQFYVQDAPFGHYTLVVHDSDESGEGGPVNEDTKELDVVGGGTNGNGR